MSAFHIGGNYLFDGFWYIEQFPLEWAKTHESGTGPNECKNCATFGSIHSGTIFVGYCANCAEYVYNFTRGHGFIDSGIEVAPQASFPWAMKSYLPSAMKSYLLGVDLDDIPPLLVYDDEDFVTQQEDFADVTQEEARGILDLKDFNSH